MFHFEHLCPLLVDVVFAWSYIGNIATVLYKPSAVFKHFSFVHLFDESNQCACNKYTRFRNFIDPLTVNEISNFTKPAMHIWTMDLSIIQHKDLRNAVAQGLNHIPWQPTNIAQAMAMVFDAYEQLIPILQLDTTKFPIQEARSRLHELCLDILKESSKCNKYGLRSSGQSVLNIPTVQNELQWLSKHLYCLGLDKAANNACFMCIQHIHFQALERLNGNDFTPCMSDNAVSSSDFRSVTMSTSSYKAYDGLSRTIRFLIAISRFVNIPQSSQIRT